MISARDLVPRRSHLFLIGGVALLISLALLGYFQYQKMSLDRERQENAKLVENLRKREGAKESESKAALLQRKLHELEGEQILWAEAIDRIGKTIPKIKESGDPVIVLRSYSGANDGKIIFNATTRENAFDPFSDISLVIKAFRIDPFFEQVFVPLITKSVTSSGATVFSFSLNAKYKKSELPNNNSLEREMK